MLQRMLLVLRTEVRQQLDFGKMKRYLNEVMRIMGNKLLMFEQAHRLLGARGLRKSSRTKGDDEKLPNREQNHRGRRHQSGLAPGNCLTGAAFGEKEP